MLCLESNVGFNVGFSLFGSQLENNASETNYTIVSQQSNHLSGVMKGLTFHVVAMLPSSMSLSFVPSGLTPQSIN
jgi:hypothetical protein